MSNIHPTKTFTYKTVGKLEIQLDLYLPEKGERVPVLLWFHGGGLVQARRDQLAPHMRKGVAKYRYACISADYRLAPQVGIKEILQDVKDCIAFIREKLPERLGAEADRIDISRLAVSGSSAGGYLALLAGLYVEPKPQVIVTFYPVSDPLGTAFSQPQPSPTGMRVPSKEEMAPFLDPNANAIASCAPEDPRMPLAIYMTVSGTLAGLLGIPSDTKDEASKREADQWRVSRNIYERGLPPAYFVVWDADSAVAVEQSDEVVGAMVGCGLEVKYERNRGGEHFFDQGEDYENEGFYGFMMKHLNS